MKIKKVNELNDSELSEKELEQYRNNKFNVDYNIASKQYILYGEYFSNGSFEPKYALMHNSFNINDVIRWYNDFINLNKNIYKNYILTEKVVGISKILDLNLLVTTQKYNL